MLFVDGEKNKYKEFLEFEKASIDIKDDIAMSVASMDD